MVRPHRIQVALPVQFPAKTPEFRLAAKPQQCPKSLLHCLPLRFESGRAKGIPHELVVDYDVRPHNVYSYRLLYTYDLVSSELDAASAACPPVS